MEEYFRCPNSGAPKQFGLQVGHMKTEDWLNDNLPKIKQMIYYFYLFETPCLISRFLIFEKSGFRGIPTLNIFLHLVSQQMTAAQLFDEGICHKMVCKNVFFV